MLQPCEGEQRMLLVSEYPCSKLNRSELVSLPLSLTAIHQPSGLERNSTSVGTPWSPVLLHFLSELSCLTVVSRQTPEKINLREGFIAPKLLDLLFLTSSDVLVWGQLVP